jgi:multidrug efflux pump subunit AcrA (membrane-fusion protein)
MYAQARLTLVNPEPNLQIPINALIVGGEGARVATVDPGGVVQIKPVKLGRDLGKEVEIIAGLSENERVINNPRDSLANGAKVRATEMQSHSDKKDGPKPSSAGAEKPKS